MKPKRIIRPRHRKVLPVDLGTWNVLEEALNKGRGQKRKLRAYDLEDGVTQSILGTFLSCRKRTEYVLNGWYLPRIKSAITYGSMFHHLLEKLYDTIIEEGDVYEDVDWRMWARRELKKWIKANAKEFSSPAAQSMARKQAAIACVIFEIYTECYRKKDFQKTKWRALEGVFDVKWRGFRLRGRWDGVFERAGVLWLLETKTKGRWKEENLKRRIAFDFQSLFYLTALAVSGKFKERLTGVLYNVIRNPQLRQGKTESDRDFLGRIEKDARKRKKHYFRRYEANFTPRRQREFMDELYMKLIEFKAWNYGLLPTFKREGSCEGRFKCDFLGACSSNSMAGYLDKGKMFQELK